MLKELVSGFYNTPPLWLKEQFGMVQFPFPELDVCDVAPIQIPSNLRLGHQMEYVFQAMIQHSPNYELLQSNILVDVGKQRLGELDFLLRDTQNNGVLHVELAYKFYIVNPEISEPIYRLMGPNKRDMFYTKLDKLREKQFPLLHHISLKSIWDAYEINPLDIEQQCCFKAQLFMPFDKPQISIRPLNTSCVRGKWIRFDEFTTRKFKGAQFYVTKKGEWVMPPHEKVPWMNHFNALMEVNLSMVKENAPMLWMKHPNGHIEKLFVVWW